MLPYNVNLTCRCTGKPKYSCDSLSSSGLEPNPQYLQGVPVLNLVTSVEKGNKAGRGLGERVEVGRVSLYVPHPKREHRGIEGSGRQYQHSQHMGEDCK